MRGLWRNIMPFASDTNGASAVFSASNALVVAQDSNGSVSTLRRVLEIVDVKAYFDTVDLPELSYAIGAGEEFERRVADMFQELVELGRAHLRPLPEFTVLLNAPVSALLGIDLDARAQGVARLTGRPAFGVETTGNKYYDTGIERAYELIAKKIVADAERVPSTMNLLGLTVLDWPGREMLKTLRDALSQHHLRIVSDLGYSDSPDRWQDAGIAERNVVASVSGLEMARALEQRFSAPYMVLSDLNWFDGWVEGLSFEGLGRVLVVGEQVQSNLVRRLLLLGGAPDVTVATFFRFDRSLAYEGDVKLKGEGDLARLVAEEGFDCVIGDGVLDAVVGDVFPLMHPATGFGRRDDTELGRAWFERLDRRASGQPELPPEPNPSEPVRSWDFSL